MNLWLAQHGGGHAQSGTAGVVLLGVALEAAAVGRGVGKVSVGVLPRALYPFGTPRQARAVVDAPAGCRLHDPCTERLDRFVVARAGLVQCRYGRQPGHQGHAQRLICIRSQAQRTEEKLTPPHQQLPAGLQMLNLSW